jgi:hypothetical protein
MAGASGERNGNAADLAPETLTCRESGDFPVADGLRDGFFSFFFHERKGLP